MAFSSSDNSKQNPAFDPDFDQVSLLTNTFWKTPLARFAQATGMTVSLYDENAVRKAGPFGKNAIFEAINKTAFFDSEAKGGLFESRAVAETIADKSLKTHHYLGILEFCTAPVFVEGSLVGVLAIGWVPTSFPDAVSSYRAAEAIGMHEMDMWAAVRMQQPMTHEKMIMNSEMLQNFVDAILLQLKLKEDDRRKEHILRILNKSAIELSHAQSISEICLVIEAAMEKLIPNSQVQVLIYDDSGREHFRLGPEIPESDASVVPIHSTRLPIQTSTRKSLGFIQITSLNSEPFPVETSELSSLTAQCAVAIQKMKLIKALSDEQQATEKINTELRALHRMKDEFLATISHELRTPLNSILGWSQLLRDEILDEDEFKDATSAIERNAKIQAKLIEDLLDVSRIISGKMKLERDLTDLRDVIMRSVETIRPTSEARHQEITLEVPDDKLPIHGDAMRLQQVIWNILSNSVKFTPEHGTLTLRLVKAGGYAKISIIDNGKGIPQEFLPHLFDRFSQADGSNSRRYGGLGLGLAIVRHIVELHGGSIRAESQGEGMGSAFHITLPINMNERELDLARRSLRDLDYSLEHGRSQLKGIRILAVDDEDDSRHILSFVLEKAGATVKAVSNVDDAIQLLKAWKPDLIISDISMPDKDGYFFIRQVRQLPASEGGLLPAIALTAYVDDKNKQEALSAGFQKHFPKPLDAKALLATIQEVSMNARY